MKQIKHIFSFKDQKNFAEAAGFYFGWIIFSSVILTIITIILYIFIFPDSFNDFNIMLTAKIGYGIIGMLLVMALTNGKKSWNKSWFVIAIILSGICSYFNPLLGFLIPSYLTTIGGDKKDADVIIV
jgi:hypothetical protein